MDDNTSINRPWFKRKIFGWGWYPSSWQGILVTIIYVAIIILGADAFDRSFAFWLLIIVASAIFIVIAKKKGLPARAGEKPKWSSGYKDSRKDSEEKYKKYY